MARLDRQGALDSLLAVEVVEALLAFRLVAVEAVEAVALPASASEVAADQLDSVSEEVVVRCATYTTAFLIVRIRAVHGLLVRWRWQYRLFVWGWRFAAAKCTHDRCTP